MILCIFACILFPSSQASVHLFFFIITFLLHHAEEMKYQIIYESMRFQIATDMKLGEPKEAASKQCHCNAQSNLWKISLLATWNAKLRIRKSKVEVSLIAHPFPARVGIVWFCRDWRKLLQTKHEVRGKWLICCSCCQCCFRKKKQIKSEDKFPTIPEIQLRVEPKKTKKLASILWNFKTWAFCCTLCLNSSLVSPYIKRKLCALLKVC